MLCGITAWLTVVTAGGALHVKGVVPEGQLEVIYLFE